MGNNGKVGYYLRVFIVAMILGGYAFLAWATLWDGDSPRKNTFFPTPGVTP